VSSSKPRKAESQEEFGDFQTPDQLAQQACALLAARGVRPRAVLEPTCERGSFLAAALSTFPTVTKAIGLEFNPEYVEAARGLVARVTPSADVNVLQADFFSTDWRPLLESLPDPLLIVGNPPWVTNAALGALGSGNLPAKSNSENLQGIAAITGKSNFDISEWMLRRALEWARGREACLAVLCKTAVARKVLLYGWSKSFLISRADIYRIDAGEEFGASVDACFLVITTSPLGRTYECGDHASLQENTNSAVFGYRDGRLVADVEAYARWRHLEDQEVCQWRSGIKHDCARVCELRKEGEFYRNGLGQLVDLESAYLYPMLKSSEVASQSMPHPSLWMLVPQRHLGEDTKQIQIIAPKTWSYLRSNAPLLDARASAIYRSRPRFSVFGVGEYAFAPWKVAVSGFYKKLNFRAIGPFQGKPVVLDDTCYFLPCDTEEEAETLCALVNSEAARGFFRSFVFWDAKRPITSDILQRLDLLELAKENALPDDAIRRLRRHQRQRDATEEAKQPQGLLFNEPQRKKCPQPTFPEEPLSDLCQTCVTCIFSIL